MIDVQYVKSHKDFMRTRFMNKVDFSEQGSFTRLLAEYGVDNEFDLIEALYSDYVNYDPHELDSIRFHELRIECAMNPEYTDKCLVSPVFADVRDDILECLHNV